MDQVGSDRHRSDAVEVGAARRTLVEAQARLVSAVAGMPDADGRETMATPELLVLLVGAVQAKERLDALESLTHAVGDII